MSVFIIPEYELKTLICSECGKYLSVLPISENDDLKYCGRCNVQGKTSGIKNKYRYGLFRCINRYEGCNKLLTFEQTIAHEEICKKSLTNCPICPRFSCNILQLKLHFEKFHPNNLLNKVKTKLSTLDDFKEPYLYCTVNEFCVIHILYEKKLNQVSFITNTTSSGNMIYQQQIFIEKVNEKNVSFKSKKTDKPIIINLFAVAKVQPTNIEFQLIMQFRTPQPVLTFDININYNKILKGVKVACIDKTTQTMEIKKKLHNKNIQTDKIIKNESFKIERQEMSQHNAEIQTVTINSVKLTDDFKLNYSDYILAICGTALISSNHSRIELTCCNCKQFTGTNVFSCLKKLHIACWNCKAWCVKCNDQMAGYNAELSTLNEVITFPCRWNCGINILGDKLRAHEKSCTHQPKTVCPLCGALCLDVAHHFMMNLHAPKVISDWNFSTKNVEKIFFLHDFNLFMYRENKVGYLRTVNIRPYGEFTSNMYLIINNKPLQIRPAQNIQFEESNCNFKVQFIITKTKLPL